MSPTESSTDYDILQTRSALGLEYILSRQRHDGSWADWNLPPGESSVWTTAYVGCKLGNLTAKLRQQAFLSSRRASEWLYRKQFPDSGWGYSEEVGTDADSTAIAITFLVSLGLALSETCYSCLRQFQCPDGGFSTYRNCGRRDSWTVSHTDVTPTALRALLTQYDRHDEAVQRGLSYVRKQRTETGVWEAFWWKSSLYSTEASLSLMRTLGLDFDRQALRQALLGSQPGNSFERALLLSCLAHTVEDRPDEEMQAIISDLVMEQKSNGSWESGAIIRLPRHDCFKPWREPNLGPFFLDQNRLFTTATVIDALSLACKVGSLGTNPATSS